LIVHSPILPKLSISTRQWKRISDNFGNVIEFFFYARGFPDIVSGSVTGTVRDQRLLSTFVVATRMRPMRECFDDFVG